MKQKLLFIALGGAFGAKQRGELVTEAARIARSFPGQLIRLAWTREEETERAGRIAEKQHAELEADEEIPARAADGERAVALEERALPVLDFAEYFSRHGHRGRRAFQSAIRKSVSRQTAYARESS